MTAVLAAGEDTIVTTDTVTKNIRMINRSA